MNILELSKKRFSARKFTDEAVSDDDLNYTLRWYAWLLQLSTNSHGSSS